MVKAGITRSLIVWDEAMRLARNFANQTAYPPFPSSAFLPVGRVEAGQAVCGLVIRDGWWLMARAQGQSTKRGNLGESGRDMASRT